MKRQNKALVDRLSRKPAVEKISIASKLDPAVHAALAEAASLAGRSISEEVERRISDSIRATDLVTGLFASPMSIRLIEGFARVVEMLERDYDGANWQNTPALAAEVRDALFRFWTIAFTEDPGPDFYRSDEPRLNIDQLGGPAPYSYSRASATAETVAKVLGFKSAAPDPQQQLKQLEELMKQESPELYAQWKSANQVASARSASGPQEKSAPKSKRSNQTQRIEK